MEDVRRKGRGISGEEDYKKHILKFEGQLSEESFSTEMYLRNILKTFQNPKENSLVCVM